MPITKRIETALVRGEWELTTRANAGLSSEDDRRCLSLKDGLQRQDSGPEDLIQAFVSLNDDGVPHLDIIDTDGDVKHSAPLGLDSSVIVALGKLQRYTKAKRLPDWTAIQWLFTGHLTLMPQ